MTVYDFMYYIALMQVAGLVVGLIWSVLIHWVNL